MTMKAIKWIIAGFFFFFSTSLQFQVFLFPLCDQQCNSRWEQHVGSNGNSSVRGMRWSEVMRDSQLSLNSRPRGFKTSTVNDRSRVGSLLFGKMFFLEISKQEFARKKKKQLFLCYESTTTSGLVQAVLIKLFSGLKNHSITFCITCKWCESGKLTHQ